MPRTKRSRAMSNSKDHDAAVKIFEKQVQLRTAKMERDAQADLKSLETYVDVLVSRLPSEICQMKLGVLRLLLDWQDQKENQETMGEVSSSDVGMRPPSVPKARKGYKAAKRTATGASDDGYATGGTSMGSTSRIAKTQTQVTSTVRTRSITGTNRSKLSEINQKMVRPKRKSKDHPNEILLKSNFQTPATLRPPNNMYGTVTPKIKPNTPLNVLRRPRQGEMVLSMQGSPLLVSAVVEEKTANINVPLSNGNVMSLLPQEGLRMSNIPPLDPETMHQLQTLKNHIEKVIKFK